MTQVRLFMAVVCLAAWSGAAYAQNVGAISGRVTDTTDAVLPGATVELTNMDTGFRRTVTADAAGFYRAPELPLGNYQVEASFSGFQRLLRSGIVITAGRDATINFQLTLGQVQEQVTVVGDAPMVETTKADMGTLVSREQISELPLRNRDFSQLITLQPGTAQYRHTGESSGVIGSRGARISVSGARPTSNSFTLDGADVNNPYGLIPSGVDGSMLGVEAIREFKVLSSNYSAQHGRASGANMVAVSRSGTNNIDGSLFWYLRNDNLDANAWGSNARNIQRQELRRNQFGGSLGGPIARDRVFFFGTYEGVRERQPRTRSVNVPTLDARNGILREIGAGGACNVSTVQVADVVRPYINLWPEPTGAAPNCGLTAEFTRSDVRPTDNDYVSVRMDYNFHSDHSIFGRYTFDDSSRRDEAVIPMFGDTVEMRNQYVTVEERSILSPRVINAVRLAYSRTAQFENTIEINPPDPSLSFVSGRPFGQITPGSGITALSGFGGRSPFFSVLNSYQVYDDVTIELSNHSLKFGGSVERIIRHSSGVSRLGGVFQFANWSAFIRNASNGIRRLRIMGPDEFACPSHGTCFTDPNRSLRQTIVATYFQDDWRVLPNLTLNLGVRHEYVTVPSEKYGRQANLENLFAPTTSLLDPLYPQTTKDNFSPRLGFAWDPTSAGTTSVRGGFAIFNEPLLFRNILTAIERQPPFWVDVDPPVAALPGLFPNLNPHLAQLALGPQAVHVLDRDVKTPYTMQSSLAVQRMFGQNSVMDIGYTWTRGIHLASRADMAIPLPIKQPDGRWLLPEPNNANYPLINPNFARLEWYGFGAYSEYHGLRMSWTQRAFQGLQLQANYTWAKAMDNLSTQFSGELQGSGVQNGFDLKADYALADFHVGHNFTTNLSYALPFATNQKWLGGWEISSIFTAQTGLPVSVDGNAERTHVLNRSGARPDLAPGGDNNPLFDDRTHTVSGQPGFLWFDPLQWVPQEPGYYGNAGRNTVIGPGVAKLDFSILKNTRITEGQNLQFRAEFFNFLNSPEFAQPSSSIFSSAAGARQQNAGLVDTTRLNSARQVQLALRYTF